MYITLLAWPRPSRQEYSPTFPSSFHSHAFASSTSYACYELPSHAVGAASAHQGLCLHSVSSRLISFSIVQAAHAEPSRVIHTYTLSPFPSPSLLCAFAFSSGTRTRFGPDLSPNSPAVWCGLSTCNTGLKSHRHGRDPVNSCWNLGDNKSVNMSIMTCHGLSSWVRTLRRAWRHDYGLTEECCWLGWCPF